MKTDIITKALTLIEGKGIILQEDYNRFVLSMNSPDYRLIDGGECAICNKPWEKENYKTKSRDYSSFRPVCECDEMSLEEKAKQKKARVTRANYHFMKAEIPADYWKCTLSNMDSDVHQSIIQGSAVARQYLELEKFRRGKWFLIFGNVGTGKTRIVCSIMRYLILEYGYSAFFLRMADFIRDSIHKGHGWVSQVLSHKVIILDDIDKLNPGKNDSQFIRERLFSLYDTAYSRGIILLMTGNFKQITDIVDLYPEEVVSRIVEKTERVSITGDDYRYRKGANSE